MTAQGAPPAAPQAPLGVAFTYQGQLRNAAGSVNGACDMQFGLWDAAGSGSPPTGGAQIGATQSLVATVANGLFTVVLNGSSEFGGSAFTGEARWLQIAVRCPAGSGAFTTFSPRQVLTAAPYALYSQAAPWSGLSDVPAGFADGVDNDTIYSAGPGLTLSGTTFAADTTYLQRRVSGACATGSAIRAVNGDGTVACESLAAAGNAWLLAGNAGTTPGTDFLGTTDARALELKVNGERALRLEPNAISPNLIGGHSANGTTPGIAGATVGGGGESGYPNRVTGNGGTVGGGTGNRSGASATVGGGYHNVAAGGVSTVGGGYENAASGHYSTVGGGQGNLAGFKWATVGGGLGNSANGQSSSIAGGSTNVASGESATVGGGYGNTATADYATIAGGGRSNPAEPATGNRVTDHYGTVGGGANNQAGSNDGDPASAILATVSGGSTNVASGGAATVGGGQKNTAGGGGATVGGGDTNTASGLQSTIGGGAFNSASNAWAAIGGGASNSASSTAATVGGGYTNVASGGDATVSGGSSNTAAGYGATVGGGQSNLADGNQATVGGGTSNHASGAFGAVGGGYQNNADGQYAAIAGGRQGAASAESATVGGGYSNAAGALYATVAGGRQNSALGFGSTVGGGDNNGASGPNATVPGGVFNDAGGNSSFAAGYRAKANQDGCFVWADYFNGDVTCDTVNRWVARASGGVYFYTNSTQTTGVFVSAGGNAWNGVSDRATKENFAPADPQAILRTLSSLPIQEYNLRSQDPSIRHIGLVAQDFAAFGFGESDKAINMQDADGVALAAIQGLYAESQALKTQDAAQQAQIAALQQQNAELAARLAALEEQAVTKHIPRSTGVPASWLLLGGLLVVGVVFTQRVRR